MPLVINFTSYFIWYELHLPHWVQWKVKDTYVISLNVAPSLWKQALAQTFGSVINCDDIKGQLHCNNKAMCCHYSISGAESIFTGMLMALEMSGGSH